MKKWHVLPLMILFLMSCTTLYAANSTDNIVTETVELSEADYYDSNYYAEPEKRYVQHTAGVYSQRESDMGMTLEEYVVDALEQLQNEIDVSAYAIPRTEASTVFFQILNNNPKLFYVDNYISWSYVVGGDTILRYTVHYLDTKENIRQQKEEFEQAVSIALEQIDSSLKPMEKALAVHDYLALNCEYDYERYLQNNVPEISHSAYGALVNRVAVCDGYADAFAYLMEEELGIPCDVVSSSSMAHAWNMVSIDGNWYHVDVTWDDPTRDSLGLVKHNYFLLGDMAISSGQSPHTGWDTQHTAVSTSYDSAFWSEINSAICYHGGYWYYAKYDDTVYLAKLMKKRTLLDEEEVEVYTENNLWNHYSGSYMYLDTANDKIYFNTGTTIYRLDDDENIVNVYEPRLSGKQLIFGFTIRDEMLYYALSETPNLTGRQDILSDTLPELTVSRIEGISADDVSVTYDGNAQTITVLGMQPEDDIWYAGEDGIYSRMQPVMINAGTYRVFYKITRNGYRTYYGNAEVVIHQAVPSYTRPNDFLAISGQTLGELELPQGFAWEMDLDTRFTKEGIQRYYVRYVPDDTINYQTIYNIAISVAVTCPEHQYASEITREATELQKGIRTYTCMLCGHTYMEYIDMITPRKPENISGLKVRMTTSASLKFSWNHVKGVRYRIELYKGSQRVSSKTTAESSCLYTGLKAGTVYTFKITPYKDINGKQYEASTRSLRASTVVARVSKLVVKNNGSDSLSISWKKVTGASGYEIRMKTGNGKYKKIKVTGKNFCIKKGLKSGRTYSFIVRAYKKTGKRAVFGTYSKEKTVTFK